MSTKSQTGKAWKIVVAVILVFVAVVGISYGSILREMDRAEQEYRQGDAESALKRYEAVEQRLRSLGMLRYIPAQDRQNLILNQAQLLYVLNRYDEAAESLDRESDMAGGLTDGRFVLLRSNIAFRKTVETYQSADKVDPQVLEETLLGIEDRLREALRLSPNAWDAKFNLELINSIRKDAKGKVEILEKKKIQEKPNLRPEQQG